MQTEIANRTYTSLKKTPSKSTTSNKNTVPRRTITDTIKVIIKNHKDKKGSHPHVILEDIENKHVSVGLSTHPKKGKTSPNYKLEQSPFNDNKESYMRRQAIVEPKRNYNNPRTGKMTFKDYSKAKEYGNKAKQKYLDK